MSIDPARPLPATAEQRVAERLQALERRLSAIEQAGRPFPVQAGSPGTDARDGTATVDRGAVRLWITVNGSWRYVTLT